MKRIKRRYLIVDVDFHGALTDQDLVDSIWKAIKRLYGEFGASQTGLILIGFDGEKRTATIRVSLGALHQVRVALASITQIAGKEAAVHVSAISGTLKSLRDKKQELALD